MPVVADHKLFRQRSEYRKLVARTVALHDFDQIVLWNVIVFHNLCMVRGHESGVENWRIGASKRIHGPRSRELLDHVKKIMPGIQGHREVGSLLDTVGLPIEAI